MQKILAVAARKQNLT